MHGTQTIDSIGSSGFVPAAAAAQPGETAAAAAAEEAANVAGSYAAASDLQGDVAAAGDSCKQTAAALPDGRASHKLQAQPKHARFSDSIKRTKAFEAFEPRPHPGLAGDSVADAVSPFEMHGAAYGDLLQVHQCSVSE
jgi:hypothetical protein